MFLLFAWLCVAQRGKLAGEFLGSCAVVVCRKWTVGYMEVKLSMHMCMYCCKAKMHR